MANNVPCNQSPVQFVNCCDVMDCIDIKSSDNSITVEKNGCGVDLTISPNNLDNLLQFNNGNCIQLVKEFIDGKLNITPVIDWECVISQIIPGVCDACNSSICPAPIELTVVVL